MLSVLIPTYNYNTLPLVKEIHHQCSKQAIVFEIIVMDDASNVSIDENFKINEFKNASYTQLHTNVGRSRIRNLLAAKANYEHLLFLDADVLPASDYFIKNYINKKLTLFDLIVGGICYESQKPLKSQMLRWQYGQKRETIAVTERNKKPFNNFASANFYIKKNVFLAIKFNEVLKTYGHEDTLFMYDFKKKNKKVVHINNPVFHLGLETNEEFLKKCLLTVENASRLKKQQLIDNSQVRILGLYQKLAKSKLLLNLLYFTGKYTEPFVLKNLLSTSPSLKILDFYKLFYLIKLERNA